MFRRRSMLLARELAVAILVESAEVLVMRRTLYLLLAHEAILVLVQCLEHLLSAGHCRARAWGTGCTCACGTGSPGCCRPGRRRAARRTLIHGARRARRATGAAGGSAAARRLCC